MRSPHDRSPSFLSVPQFPRRIVLGGAILFTCVFVFLLPLYVKAAPVAGISASYLAGFNNSFAALSTAGLSLGVLGALLFWRQPHSEGSWPVFPPLTWRFAGLVVLASACLQAFWGTLVILAGQRYLGDAGYMIEQATVWLNTDRRLYSQIEFAYGPLLLVPAALLSKLLHIPVTAAYFTVLVLESALGLCMVVWLLNELPIRTSLRRAALVLLAIVAITPHLGLNYTWFRFASPLFLLLFAMRSGRSPVLAAIFMSTAILVQLAISPELALSLGCGLAVSSILKARIDGSRWLLPAVCAFAVLCATLLTLGRGYLAMIATFARGVYNLPVGPYPHVLFLLATAVWLTPLGLASRISLDRPRDAGWCALYATGLAMLPAALGRCDPLHTLFNGVAFLLFTMVGVSTFSRLHRWTWIAAFAFVVLWEQRVNAAFFSYRTAQTVQRALLPHVPSAVRAPVIWCVSLPNRDTRRILKQPPARDPHLNLAALNQFALGAPIATPLEITPTVEEDLKSSNQYAPLYHAFGMDVMDAQAELAEDVELDQFRWMLLPSERHLAAFQQLPSNIGPLQGMRMYFHLRRPVLFVPGALFENYVHEKWLPVQTFGENTLYRRKEEKAQLP